MRDLTKFVLHHRLAACMQRSSLTLTELGYPHGLTQSRLSALLHGKAFGPQTRTRVVALGAACGLPPQRCTRRCGRSS